MVATCKWRENGWAAAPVPVVFRCSGLPLIVHALHWLTPANIWSPRTVQKAGGMPVAVFYDGRERCHAISTVPRLVERMPFSNSFIRLLACPSQNANSTSARGVAVGLRLS